MPSGGFWSDICHTKNTNLKGYLWNPLNCSVFAQTIENREVKVIYTRVWRKQQETCKTFLGTISVWKNKTKTSHFAEEIVVTKKTSMLGLNKIQHQLWSNFHCRLIITQGSGGKIKLKKKISKCQGKNVATIRRKCISSVFCWCHSSHKFELIKTHAVSSSTETRSAKCD